MKRGLLFGSAPLLGLLVAAALLVVYGFVEVDRALPGNVEPRPLAEPVAPPAAIASTQPRPLPTLPSQQRGVATRPVPASDEPKPKPKSDHADDEQLYMDQLRALRVSDPESAVWLAREGERRFPLSANAAERYWLLVRALTDLEQFEAAREEAQSMVDRYPDSDWSRDVKRHVLTQLPSPAERNQ